MCVRKADVSTYIPYLAVSAQKQTPLCGIHNSPNFVEITFIVDITYKVKSQ